MLVLIPVVIPVELLAVELLGAVPPAATPVAALTLEPVVAPEAVRVEALTLEPAVALVGTLTLEPVVALEAVRVEAPILAPEAAPVEAQRLLRHLYVLDFQSGLACCYHLLHNHF